MNSIQCLVLLAAACDGLALGSRPLTSRRAVLAGALALPAAAGTASAAEEDLIDVYFGCGCFWHVQHEFVEAERKILGRSDSELTAFTGYAGGRAGLRDGKVCYHNAAQVSDYGSMGHAEVVGLRIPRASFGDFATEYCKLFDKNGFRPDQLGDRGTEYRNLVAMPGGSSGDLAKELIKASQANGDKLDFAAGKGDDADVRGLVWVMDVQQWPFFLGERYHQYHDGFAWGEDYPGSYNNLAAKQIKLGRLPDSGCPNGMMGIGIAGL